MVKILNLIYILSFFLYFVTTLCPSKKWTPKEIAIMQQKLVTFV